MLERTQGRAGAELSAAELLDNAPDAIIVMGPDERIALVNVQAERLFGYARAELLGQPLELLVPERFRHKHDAHVKGYRASPQVRPMGEALELSGRHKDGSDIPIEVTLSPVGPSRGPSVAAAIRDITKRRRSETKARVSTERLVSAIEHIHDAIAIFDAEDRLVICNTAYRHLVTGATNSGVTGLSYENLLDLWLINLSFATDEERDAFRAERLQNRKEPKGAVEVRTRDGRSLRVMDRRTDDGGIVKTVWDLTQDVHLSEELRQARVAAEAGSTAKSEFLSSMSHELRTPLNAILGFAQLLQRDLKETLSVRNRKRVDQIVNGGEHLLRLIDDVLDLSRIEAGKISMSPEAVNVRDVLRNVVTTLEPMAASLGIHIEAAPVEASIPVIQADRTRYAQVLMNFGSNAIKYNRFGGRVMFHVTQPRPDVVRVTVNDTGMGIATGKRDKLFQPFQRAGQEAGSIEGTGIGLVISKQLAELMNGAVGFMSTEGKGSEFWVEMPVLEARVPSPPAAHAQSRFRAVTKTTVLYVEDNAANVSFMEDLIGTFENLQLITAPTAEIGIELARVKQPALIIMDINLPGMSGLDALKVLHAEERTSDIPIIAVTAAASERDRKHGQEAGFFRYLTKPLKVDEFEATLQLLFAGT